MNTPLNPRIEVQNLEGDFWLVRLVHDFSNGETIDTTVKVKKHNRLPLAELNAKVIDRLQELLAKIQD